MTFSRTAVPRARVTLCNLFLQEDSPTFDTKGKAKIDPRSSPSPSPQQPSSDSSDDDVSPPWVKELRERRYWAGRAGQGETSLAGSEAQQQADGSAQEPPLSTTVDVDETPELQRPHQRLYELQQELDRGRIRRLEQRLQTSEDYMKTYQTLLDTEEARTQAQKTLLDSANNRQVRSNKRLLTLLNERIDMQSKIEKMSSKIEELNKIAHMNSLNEKMLMKAVRERIQLQERLDAADNTIEDLAMQDVVSRNQIGILQQDNRQLLQQNEISAERLRVSAKARNKFAKLKGKQDEKIRKLRNDRRNLQSDLDAANQIAFEHAKAARNRKGKTPVGTAATQTKRRNLQVQYDNVREEIRPRVPEFQEEYINDTVTHISPDPRPNLEYHSTPIYEVPPYVPDMRGVHIDGASTHISPDPPTRPYLQNYSTPVYEVPPYVPDMRGVHIDGASTHISPDPPTRPNLQEEPLGGIDIEPDQPTRPNLQVQTREAINISPSAQEGYPLDPNAPSSSAPTQGGFTLGSIAEEQAGPSQPRTRGWRSRRVMRIPTPQATEEPEFNRNSKRLRKDDKVTRSGRRY